jgi:hypothetical protein
MSNSFEKDKNPEIVKKDHSIVVSKSVTDPNELERKVLSFLEEIYKEIQYNYKHIPISSLAEKRDLPNRFVMCKIMTEEFLNKVGGGSKTSYKWKLLSAPKIDDVKFLLLKVKAYSKRNDGLILDEKIVHSEKSDVKPKNDLGVSSNIKSINRFETGKTDQPKIEERVEKPMNGVSVRQEFIDSLSVEELTSALKSKGYTGVIKKEYTF